MPLQCLLTLFHAIITLCWLQRRVGFGWVGLGGGWRRRNLRCLFRTAVSYAKLCPLRLFHLGGCIQFIMHSPSNHHGDDDLLYGDLEDAAIAKPSSSSTQALTMTELDIEQLRLRQQLQSLKAENDILKQNMGILYRTAKAELDRKDRTILELQSELDSLR